MRAGEVGVGGSRQRFFRSGELHLVLLALLADRPRHGYELMTELATRFGPDYRPSPGSVYPALGALEAESLVVCDDDGDRRVYQLTPLGSKALTGRRALLEVIEVRTGARLGPSSASQALASFNQRVRRVEPLIDADDLDALLGATAERIERLAMQGECDDRRL